MTDDSANPLKVPEGVCSGSKVLDAAFSQHRERLKRMVRLRLDPRLQGRVDASDVLQDAYLEASRRYETYSHSSEVPLFLWLRGLTIKHLIAVHRRHLLAQRRTSARDVSLQGRIAVSANASSMAQELSGRLTSPSQAAIKDETRANLQRALESMDEADRDVLMLRHFEQLSNAEAAQVLEIQESTASKRYARALKRLQKILVETGMFETGSK